MNKFYSNNCIKVSNCEYISKYMILNNNNKYFTLKEYNIISGEYKTIKDSFNYNAFMEYLKNNNIKKYFSEVEFLNYEK